MNLPWDFSFGPSWGHKSFDFPHNKPLGICGIRMAFFRDLARKIKSLQFEMWGLYIPYFFYKIQFTPHPQKKTRSIYHFQSFAERLIFMQKHEF